MKQAFHHVWLGLLMLMAVLPAAPRLAAEALPLKRAVELALGHSSTMGAGSADAQRAFASYREARNQYLPQFILGSGLGKSWGFPLTLEGSAPAILNLNAQSALINPALRDFVRAARTDWQATTLQNRDQRNQVIQDTVLSYAELAKWEALLNHLQQEQDEAKKTQDVVEQRVREGVDNLQEQNKARLTMARVRLRRAEAQGAIDVLRDRLARLTGLPPSSIETDPDSMPALPEIKQEEDLAGKAVQFSPLVQAAEGRAAAQDFRARGEHRAMWPQVDFAAQYAVLSRYNNYDQFFQPQSFQRNNATVGVSIRFPFFNTSQRARAESADAEALRARKETETTKNQVSEETLKLQRAVAQLTAALEVASLEYQVAQSSLEAAGVRADSGTATIHDVADARTQANGRYSALQDAGFELERAQIGLLRATGGLDNWLGLAK